MLVEKMGFNVSVTGIPKTKIFKGHTQTTGFWGVLLNYQFIISESVKGQNSNHKSILSSTLTLAFFLLLKITVENSQAVKIIQATNKQLQMHF